MSDGNGQPAPPDVSTFALLRRSARSLRSDASLVEAVVRLKGDEGGALATFARGRRELADACDRRAGEIGPVPAAVTNWGRGNAEAIKSWNPPKGVPEGLRGDRRMLVARKSGAK